MRNHSKKIIATTLNQLNFFHQLIYINSIFFNSRTMGAHYLLADITFIVLGFFFISIVITHRIISSRHLIHIDVDRSLAIDLADE